MPLAQSSAEKPITVTEEVSLKINVYVKGTLPRQPIKDVTVTPMMLMGSDPDTGEELWWRIEAKKAKTDQYGVALIYGLGPDFYAIEATHPDFHTATVKDIDLYNYIYQEVNVEIESISIYERMLKSLLPLAFIGVFTGVSLYAVSKA